MKGLIGNVIQSTSSRFYANKCVISLTKLYLNIRHAETGLDLDAEANLQALRDLHRKEIRENGVDNLTPQEAYSRVFKNPTGLKSGKSGVLGAAKVREKFQELEQASTQRESALHAEIQNLNAEIEKMKQESLERENKMKQEMIDRENKLRQDIIAEMAKIMRGSS